jgi:hypothetical protein
VVPHPRGPEAARPLPITGEAKRYAASRVAALRQKLSGHFGYFAIIGNSQALYTFRRRVSCVWRKWLSRRSQRAELSWVAMNRLLAQYPLPQPHLRRPRDVVKPWAEEPGRLARNSWL